MAHIRRWPFYWIRRNVSIEMLKAGMASIYTSKGAEYGKYLSHLEKAEKQAKSVLSCWFRIPSIPLVSKCLHFRRRKKGIWSQKDFVDPSEHKKQFLRGGDSPQ
jgi:endonuclease YncB( thermonuclease family)